jgi:hypothetical protein
MNMFLITVGCFAPAVTNEVVAAAKRIGPVEIDKDRVVATAPDIGQYIAKVEKAGRLGKKKKQARC